MKKISFNCENKRNFLKKISGGAATVAWGTPTLTAVTLPAHGQASIETPIVCSDFPFIENTNWYETVFDVPLASLGSLRFVLELQNDTTENFIIVEEFQLWSIPSVISSPELPVTINSLTTGIVLPGGTLTYDITIDVSGLPESEIGLGFRGQDDNLFGNIRPNIASIVSSSIECDSD